MLCKDSLYLHGKRGRLGLGIPRSGLDRNLYLVHGLPALIPCSAVQYTLWVVFLAKIVLLNLSKSIQYIFYKGLLLTFISKETLYIQ